MQQPIDFQNLTETAKKVFLALKDGPAIPEALARKTGIPLKEVNGGLEELFRAALVTGENEEYKFTERGEKLVRQGVT